MDICSVDNLHRLHPQEKRFRLSYHFLNLRNHRITEICLKVDETEILPRLVHLYKNAEWMEQEVHDFFGLKFEGGDLPRPHSHLDHGLFPLRKDAPLSKQAVWNSPLTLDSILEDQTVITEEPSKADSLNWIKIGPHHPATQGGLQLSLALDGEEVLQCQIERGWLHKGIEKICENKKYSQISPFIDRLNYQSCPMNHIFYCMTVEKLLKINIPPRAMALRMVLMELGRITDHLMAIGHFAAYIGQEFALDLCYQERERICELYSQLGEQRLTLNINCFGGLSREIPLAWMNETLKSLQEMEKQLDYLQMRLQKSPAWMSRTQTGYISSAKAMEWGLTGPNLRASVKR